MDELNYRILPQKNVFSYLGYWVDGLKTRLLGNRLKKKITQSKSKYIMPKDYKPNKYKSCDCAEKSKKLREEPKIYADDLLWAYFAMKMLNEVFADKATREKFLEKNKAGPLNLFELSVMREIQKKDPSLFEKVDPTKK